MTATSPSPVVDARAVRLSQGLVAALVLGAAALGEWRLLVLPALHLALSVALGRRGNVAVLAFDAFARPLLAGPRPEDARPPRFANAVGLAFLAGSLAAHAAGAAVAGWGLALVVGSLALVAAVTGACLACWTYGYLRPARALLRRLR